jgi:hypothetical protein
MEVTILIKYGLNEQFSIDVTKFIIDNYCKKNVISISSNEFGSFAPTFYPDITKFLFFSCKINEIEKKRCYIDNGENVFIDLKQIFTFESQKKIIVYTPEFNFNSGGVVCLHYLAQLISKCGYDVYLYPQQHMLNPLFNKYYNGHYVNDNTPVIYPEVHVGNILKAKNVIRWILAPIGINTKTEIVKTWNKHDLVYYFNDETKITANPDKKGSIYKMLTTIFLNPLTKNKNSGFRQEYCFTSRKTQFYKNVTYIHPSNAFQILAYHNQITCIDIFNNYKFFVCYDPMCFLIVIAAICGCVSIVYPIENKSKKEWINTIGASDYCKQKGIDNLFGIAYGKEDIEWAKSTLHLVEEQWKDIIKFNMETNVVTFIEDLKIWDSGTLQNTIENNY